MIKNDSFDFDLTQLGYAADEAVPVYDIWEKQSAGTATGLLKSYIPSHGAKLYRLGDRIADGIKGIDAESRTTKDKSVIHKSSNKHYDLTGRRVKGGKPLHGIYIVDGRLKVEN